MKPGFRSEVAPSKHSYQSDSPDFGKRQAPTSSNFDALEVANRKLKLSALSTSVDNVLTREVATEKAAQREDRISWFQAWLLPKVLFYAFAYFCAKASLQVVFFSLFEFLDSEFTFGG